MQCVILAGGKGTRLRPYTYLVPKPLLPYREKPILEHIIGYLKGYGIKDAIISIGYLGYQIKNYFGDGSQMGIRIEYIEEKEPLGTAGCLNLLRGKLKETFLLFGGDNITSLNLNRFTEYHKAKGGIMTVALFDFVTKVAWGVYNLENDGSISGFLEKPEYHHNAGTMIFCLEPEIFDYIPKGSKHLNLTDDVIPKVLKAGRKIYGYKFSEEWIDLGNIEDYKRITK